MLGVRVQVVRYVDDSFPGFVECELLDVHGRLWVFVDKGPVVAGDYVNANSTYPRPGMIACEVVGRRTDSLGREIVQISTERPWDIASAEGITSFEIFAEALIDLL